jgi:hypothetical protein
MKRQNEPERFVPDQGNAVPSKKGQSMVSKNGLLRRFRFLAQTFRVCRRQ